MLHLMGPDHKRLTFRFQGRDFRLTDVHGEIITKLTPEPVHLALSQIFFTLRFQKADSALRDLF